MAGLGKPRLVAPGSVPFNDAGYRATDGKDFSVTPGPGEDASRHAAIDDRLVFHTMNLVSNPAEPP